MDLGVNNAWEDSDYSIAFWFPSVNDNSYHFFCQELFDNDWYKSRNIVGLADIIVLKYSVNDKNTFQEVKDNYVPMIKRILNQWTVPVIIAAIGTRQNGE